MKYLDRLNSRYFTIGSGKVDISESSVDGAGTISFVNCGDFVQLGGQSPFPHQSWLSERKCADGAFVRIDDSHFSVHIVELKSKLTRDEWIKAKRQISGMLLNVLSVLGSSEQTWPFEVTAYIAFKEDNVLGISSSSPMAMKRTLGDNKSLSPIPEWTSLEFDVLGGRRVRLIKVARDGGGNASVDMAKAA